MTSLPVSVATDLHLQVRGADQSRDIALSLTANDVSFAEVLQALSLPEGTMIDGRSVVHPATTPAVQALSAGSQLHGSDGNGLPAPGPASNFAVEVAVVAGLDAGAIRGLDAGTYRLHESQHEPDAGWYVKIDGSRGDPVALPWHQQAPSIETVNDRRVVLALGSAVDPEPGHSRAVHRPPRALPPDDVDPINLVAPPPLPSRPTPLSWATLLAPIPIALMMAFFFRPIFALFAAMGPIMAVGRWYESRRRFRRADAERSTAVAVLRAALAVAVESQRENQAKLRWLRDPHIAELWRRARTNSVRLWERRPGAPGYMVVMVGVGPERVAVRVNGDPSVEIHAHLGDPFELRPVPHTIDLAKNSGLGLHGDRAAALAMARASILQLATLHGPADLKVGVVCDAAVAGDWDWLKWLPHADVNLSAHTARALVKELKSRDPVGASPLRPALVNADEIGVVYLIVVDDVNADVAAICRAGKAAGCSVRVVAIASTATLVPAACSSLISVHGDAAEIASPELTGRRTTICPVGISMATATSWARSLAPLIDPEVQEMVVTGDRPVSLLSMVGFTSADDLVRGWDERAVDAAPIAALGAGDEGAFQVNLTEDGPHALIAGTTGSGKSELLRTLVISLAAACPPEHLNFVLIDFKGGGAFDVVDRLPHVAGSITDLDESLIERALQSLRSELQRREVLFRELGVSTYTDAALRSAEPIARLVIVIDEFAALATDYGELMAAIIDLAARGRSLGMHLILATQRPSGVVDQKIRANTNLRIALRVQDAFDSQDVIGIADAAAIDRKSPGRAIARVGGDVAVRLQTAYSGAIDTRSTRCIIRPHRLFASHDESAATDHPAGAPTELDVLVDAIVSASARRDHSARPLWADPLPTTLDWIDLGARELAASPVAEDAEPGFVLGLADVPDRQTQVPWRWDPASGALAIYAASAQCAGKVLVSLGAALALGVSNDDMHVYVIDGDGGTTAPLASLAHVGAYIKLGEVDRIERTVRLFESSLAERRHVTQGQARPRLVLMIDNLAAVLAVHDDIAAAALVDRLGSIARDGAQQGIHLAITARTVRDVGHRLAQQIPQRLVLALADPGGYLTLGLKSSDVVSLPAMRAIDIANRLAVQLVEPPDLTGWPTTASTPGSASPIGSFPDRVDRAQLLPAVRDADGALSIPMGIDNEHLAAASLTLQPGEHALVVASPGMGRSSAALLLLHQLAAATIGLDIVRVASARSPLNTTELPGRLVDSADEISELVSSERQVVVIVDDADLVPSDIAAAFTSLIEQRPAHCRIVATTSFDAARLIRSWTTPIRTAGTGLVLGGTIADGEMFKVRFGHIAGLGSLPGRGHLVVRGRVAQVQIAHPDAPH